jgi:hypothetical protein
VSTLGEHKTNIVALLAKTLPTFPPAGRDGQVQIGWRVQPKRHILLLMAADMREVDGEKQFRQSDDGAWEKLPDGCEMHLIGEPLPPEKCDVVFGLVAMWVDTQSARQGQQRAGASALPGEFGRIDLCEFLKRAELSLPSERRIVTPGLGLVP